MVLFLLGIGLEMKETNTRKNTAREQLNPLYQKALDHYAVGNFCRADHPGRHGARGGLFPIAMAKNAVGMTLVCEGTAYICALIFYFVWQE